MERKNKILVALICGMICGTIGCICMGAGDWLMMYGDTTYNGDIYWLTNGVAQISPWRNTLAMVIAFPGIIFYGIGLFALCEYIKGEKYKKTYRTLTAFGLTPWLCLHLFYVMILYLFSWLTQNGFEQAALPAAQALYSHLSWLPLVSEIIMIPPFLYWFYLQFANKTLFPKVMAFTNILIIYALLYGVKMLLPDSPFRLGFTNGLMSEAMIIWFAIMLVWTIRVDSEEKNQRKGAVSE